MIPLIKIRATYLKRKKGTIVCSYLFIPTIIIVGVIIYLVNKDPDKPVEMDKKRIFPENYDYYLFRDSNFTELNEYIRNTSLVCRNDNIGKKFVDYIYSKTKITLKLYSSEDKLDNYSQNIIILNYNQKKKAYKFTYKEKEIIDLDNHFPFNSFLLSSENASDLFKYDYDNYIFAKSQNMMFLKYQSFIAKFLLELENKEIKKDIHFNFGLNSYPPAVKNPKNYDTLEPILGYFVAMQFSLIFLSFSIQMLEEKDMKLEKLLERQGIGNFKYIASWFINYLFVSLFANIASLMGSFQILESFYGLFIFYLILYNISLFSLSFFIVSISNNKKSGIILVYHYKSFRFWKYDIRLCFNSRKFT